MSRFQLTPFLGHFAGTAGRRERDVNEKIFEMHVFEEVERRAPRNRGFPLERSQIFGREPCHFCQARKHTRADFVTVVKCEDDIRLPAPLENSMGTGCSLDLPADAEKRGENSGA